MDQVSHNPSQDYDRNNPGDSAQADLQDWIWHRPDEVLITAAKDTYWLAVYICRLEEAGPSLSTALPVAAALVAAHMAAKSAEDRL
jgi:hypothetical protein